MGHFERIDKNGESHRRDRRSTKRRNRREIKLGAESLEQRVLMRSSPFSRSMLADSLAAFAEARAARPSAADLLNARLARVSAMRGGRAEALPEATRAPGDAGSTTTATFSLVAR